MKISKINSHHQEIQQILKEKQQQELILQQV